MITYQVTVTDFGKQEWKLMGRLHREDGPAVVFGDNQKWWLNGINYTEEGFEEEMRRRASESAETSEKKVLEELGSEFVGKIEKEIERFFRRLLER